MYSRKVQSCLGSNLTSFPWLSELNSPHHIISKINWCYCEKYWSRAIHYTVYSSSKGKGIFLSGKTPSCWVFKGWKYFHFGLSVMKNIFIKGCHRRKNLSFLSTKKDETLWERIFLDERRMYFSRLSHGDKNWTFRSCNREIITALFMAVTGR